MKMMHSPYDFSAIRPAMQRYVDQDILAGVSSAVLVGGDLVHLDCVGWADKENAIALRSDHLFRVFSNTKLITSIALLLLMEEGHCALDEAIENYLPQLGNRRVLRPGATDIHDTEAASSSITIRHLLCHSSGLSYGWMDKNSLLNAPYAERGVFQSLTSLSAMVDALQELPLAFHPGTTWEYSIASDVLARLVEVLSGQSFDAFLSCPSINKIVWRPITQVAIRSTCSSAASNGLIARPTPMRTLNLWRGFLAAVAWYQAYPICWR